MTEFLNSEISSIFTVLFSKPDPELATLHCGGNVVAYAFSTSPQATVDIAHCHPVDPKKYPNWKCNELTFLGSHHYCVVDNIKAANNSIYYCTCSKSLRYTENASNYPALVKAGITSICVYINDEDPKKRRDHIDHERNYSKCNNCWDNDKGFK